MPLFPPVRRWSVVEIYAAMDVGEVFYTQPAITPRISVKCIRAVLPYEPQQNRGLAALALPEFALRIDGLDRFVRHEPLRAFTNACSAC